MRLRNMIWIGLVLACGAGCSDFLDVQPKDKQSEKQLFSTRGGFYMAVNGIYNKVASTALYGKNLSYELVDVISKRYSPLQANTYLTALSSFDYADNSVQTGVSNTWTAAYNTILNCNVVLDNLEESDGILLTPEYRMLKGEMLALRAFLHFDMLRAFAVNYSVNPDGMAIPYAESFTKKIHPQLKAKEVVEKILADLNAAREALKSVDPVFDETFRDQYTNYHYAQPYKNDIFMSYRAYRMNYYAVTGLMARVYCYIGDKNNAYKYAKEIIDAADDGAFWFASEYDVSASLKNRDIVMQSELLFALNCVDIQDLFYSLDASNYKNLSLLEVNNIYTESSDFRRSYLIGESSVSGKTVSYKYAKIDSSKGGKIPMIRLSEMYMIAAESYYSVDKDLAAGYLGKVRRMRGISPEVKSDMYEHLMEEIILEARREFVGEGQLFYLYKRLNHPVIRNNAEIVLSTAQYCLPLPANEVEFGDREEEYLKY